MEKYLEVLFRLVTLLIRVNVKFILKVSKCILDIIDINDRDSTPARLLLMKAVPLRGARTEEKWMWGGEGEAEQGRERKQQSGCKINEKKRVNFKKVPRNEVQ